RAVLHHRERQARIDPPPVDQHGAGAALAVVAPLLGAGEVELKPQRIKQRGPRRHGQLVRHAVDVKRDRQLVGQRKFFRRFAPGGGWISHSGFSRHRVRPARTPTSAVRIWDDGGAREYADAASRMTMSMGTARSRTVPDRTAATVERLNLFQGRARKNAKRIGREYFRDVSSRRAAHPLKRQPTHLRSKFSLPNGRRKRGVRSLDPD